MNLRGPAFKLAPTAIAGFFASATDFAGYKAKTVHLYERDFRVKIFEDGRPVSRARPPVLPGNVLWMNDRDRPARPAPKYGALLAFSVIPEIDNINLIPGARVMGPLHTVKEYLRGRKFHILNRCDDWICVEIV